MNDLCTDIGYLTLNKHGETLCGDHIEIIETENNLAVVLSDGLGSGVKASILSTLSSKIIATMIANSIPLDECVRAIAKTLPVCKERKIAYSTFTIIKIVNNKEAEIIEYDNPKVVFLNNGKYVDYPVIVEDIEGKSIYKSRIKLTEGDTFVLFSDGALNAGVGRSLNLNWTRCDIIEFLENIYNNNFTAKTLSTLLVNKCYSLYGGKPKDDTSVCTIKIRKRVPMNLLMGPPSNPSDVEKMMSLFFSKEGKHIVCGGTTSKLAAEFLGKEVDCDIDKDTIKSDKSVPPISKIEGVDLATEGAITIGKVLDYAKNYLDSNDSYANWAFGKDGASLIAKLLFEEATDINFFIGKAQNPAYDDADFPIGHNLKLKLAEDLADCLWQMGKRVKISYF